MIVAPLVPLALMFVGAPAADPSAQGALDHAIHLFESFEDEDAATALHALLSRSAPGEVAAKAHLYLALIALNSSKPDEVREQFRRALEANPGIELPPGSSPKARLAFAQARREMMAELEAGSAAPGRPPPVAAGKGPFDQSPTRAAPEAATSAEVPKAALPHSHTTAYIVGAVTLVLAGVAVYGGIQVLDYNSMVNSGNAGVAAGAKPAYNLDQLNSARGSASFWAVGWLIAAGLGAAGATGTVLTW